MCVILFDLINTCGFGEKGMFVQNQDGKEQGLIA